MFMYVFLAQAISISIIVYVLKKILDNMLVEMAIRQFEYSFNDQGQKPPAKFLVISHKKLKGKYQQRIAKSVQKIYNGKIAPVFQIDKSIQGGVVIFVGDKELEYSLRNRLKQALSN